METEPPWRKAAGVLRVRGISGQTRRMARAVPEAGVCASQS